MVKTDADVKTWKTRKNAERFLSLKDPSWASTCRIEALTNDPEFGKQGS